MYTRVQAHAHTCVHTRVRACVHIYTLVLTYAFTPHNTRSPCAGWRVHTHIYTVLCIPNRMQLYTYHGRAGGRTRTCKWVDATLHTIAHTYVCRSYRIPIRIHVHACAAIDTHAPGLHMHVHTHSHMYTCVCTCSRMYAYVNT